MKDIAAASGMPHAKAGSSKDFRGIPLSPGGAKTLAERLAKEELIMQGLADTEGSVRELVFPELQVGGGSINQLQLRVT